MKPDFFMVRTVPASSRSTGVSHGQAVTARADAKSAAIHSFRQ